MPRKAEGFFKTIPMLQKFKKFLGYAAYVTLFVKACEFFIAGIEAMQPANPQTTTTNEQPTA